MVINMKAFFSGPGRTFFRMQYEVHRHTQYYRIENMVYERADYLQT